MRLPDEYLADLKSQLISDPKIANVTIIREEVQGGIGLYRYKVSFVDGGLLEMFERFEIQRDGKILVTKYSFHWQDAHGRLLKRWDNARHHPEIASYPHHLHDGAEENVVAHDALTASECLHFIETAVPAPP